MIFDTLDHLDRYAGLGGNLPAALDYLRGADLDALPVGRTDPAGEAFYVLVQEYETRLPEQGKWEAHRRYIDVQVMARGTERMGFAAARTLQAGEYIEGKDFCGFSGTGSAVDVPAGAFVIFYPEDAHMPCLQAGQAEAVRKVVLKVRA